MTQGVESRPLPSVESSHSEYPLQQHAGKVSYGPNYNVGAVSFRLSILWNNFLFSLFSQSAFDKVGGRAQEVIGKITHSPRLVSKGHERHTGENKTRKALVYIVFPTR